MTDTRFTTCLWFDSDGEAAANFYTSVFKDARIGRVSHYTDAGPGPAGSVMAVEFELNGQKFLALNGGPVYAGFTETISFQIPCADQAEVDYYWERLREGGQEDACGWLKDKFGLSWQVIPNVFVDMVSDPDPAKVKRVTDAMFTMSKFDIAGLERAYAGE